MTTVFFVTLLVVLWTALLVPPMLKNRTALRRPGDSVGSFSRQMRSLSRANPGDALDAVTERGSQATKVAMSIDDRRRRAIFLLGAAVAFSLVFAIAWGGWMYIAVHLLADALLIAYISLMMRAQRIAAEREMKVAFLPHAHSGAEPTQLLERVVNR